MAHLSVSRPRRIRARASGKFKETEPPKFVDRINDVVVAQFRVLRISSGESCRTGNSGVCRLISHPFHTPATAAASHPKAPVIVHLILERVASSLVTKFWSLEFTD